MAVDYGDARIGIAVSDIGGFICGEAWTMREKSAVRAAERIAQEANDRGVERVIVGLPKNMDGSLGPRAEKSEKFARLIEHAGGLSVVLWDERRTTVDAHRILSESGKRGAKRKAVIDAVAASLILEGYLGSINGSARNN